VVTPTKLSSKKPKLESSHQGPRSLLRTLRIIEMISSQPETATLARLSHDLQTPKSSLLGLLRALSQHGYLLHESNHYVLGPAAHRLAMAIIPNLTLPQVARPIMRDLAAETGETVVLAVLDPELRRVVYVDKVESTSTIRYTVPIGTTRPLYCTAGGRVLLAHQPSQWVSDYLSSGPFEKRTKNTVTDPSKLKSVIAKVRQNGYSTTLAESSDDVAGFSAPVFDVDGRAAFALNVGAPIERGRKFADRYLAATRAAADNLSVRLGSAIMTKGRRATNGPTVG
jgi:DNA-binding IclR family transcriptional regulator